MSRPGAMAAVPHRRAPWVVALLVVLTAAPLLVLALFPRSAVPMSVRILAALLCLLALLPSWIYLLQSPARRAPIPFIPIVGLMYGMYFGVPVLVGNVSVGTRVVLDPNIHFHEPTLLALFGWLFLLVGYYGLGLIFPGEGRAEGRDQTLDGFQPWGFAFLYGGLGIDALIRFVSVPQALKSVLNLLHSFSLFGSALLVSMALTGLLSRRQHLFAYLGILALAGMQLGTGLVSNFAFLGAVIFLSVWLTRRYLGPQWLLAAAVGLLLIVALKTVTAEYRKLAWNGTGEISGLLGAQLMGQMLVDNVRSEGLGATLQRGLEAVATRSSVMDLLADVVDRTPLIIPHLHGETYESLVGMAVPRVLWPDKPTKDIGQMFGHRYDYLDVWDGATSVNCPFVIEFYMNYGAWGVLIGMLLVGIIYRMMRNAVNRPGQGPLVSLMGVAVLVPLLNIESDFSLIFGGLLMNGAVQWTLLRTMRHLRTHGALDRTGRAIPALEVG